MRGGEEHCLLVEGWRDCFHEAPRVATAPSGEWIRKMGANSARYDRVSTHGNAVKCECLRVIPGMWSALSDNVALHAVLRHEERVAVGLPEVELESESQCRSGFGSAYRIVSL